MLKISRALGIAAVIAAATTSFALAQPREQPGQTAQAPGGTDPHDHSETSTSPSVPRGGSGGAQQNMPGQGMRGQRMDGAQSQSGGSSMPMMGMSVGGMRMGMPTGMGMSMGRSPMMKIMFAIADADGNGAVSFNEITEIHKRMFNTIDANKDGAVTLEEIESFLGK